MKHKYERETESLKSGIILLLLLLLYYHYSITLLSLLLLLIILVLLLLGYDSALKEHKSGVTVLVNEQQKVFTITITVTVTITAKGSAYSIRR